MAVYWSGEVSPDSDDIFNQYYRNPILAALSNQFSDVSISLGPVGQFGTRTLHIQGTFNGSGDPALAITNAVLGSGDNLAVGTVQYSSDIISSSGAIPFTDQQPPTFQPTQVPVAILGNPAFNPDGSVTLPAMQIDYSAPNAPPVPVVMTDAIVNPRGGAPVRSRPLPLDDGPGNIKQLPVNVLPPLDYLNPGQSITPTPMPVLLASAGSQIDWSGEISPVSDTIFNQYYLDPITSALANQFSNVSIALGSVNPNTGALPIYITAVFNGSGDPTLAITNAVAGAGTNLALNSVQSSAGTPPAVVPVVVTTTPSVPIPTQQTPQLPMQPLDNPIYVPAQQAPVSTPGIPPPSPDPASTIVSGTPIQTPNIPAPTTTVSVPVPTTDTINILGVQVSKTFAIIAALGIGYMLLSSGNKK